MSMPPPPGGQYNPWPPQNSWPPAPGVPMAASSANRGTRWLVGIVLAVLVGAYVVAAVLTKDRWLAGTTEGARLTFQPAEGSSTSPESLRRARDVLRGRLIAQGADDARVDVVDDTITVVAPGADPQQWSDVGATGQLYLRPVVHAMPAQSSGTSTAPPKTPDSQEISDEKQLRQSTDQSIQLLAMQFQATRCGEHDVLAGRDDPDLPLITCSRDGTGVYLLDKALIDGEQVEDASVGDGQTGQRVVDVVFDSEAADRWATFTEANIGTRVAFTLDTAVVSAPEIREAIPGGRTQISGDFTRETARDLAANLDGGALPFPLTLESSTTEMVQVPGSTAWRIGIIAGGVLVALLVIGGVVVMVALGRRGRAAPPGYAADVMR